MTALHIDFETRSAVDIGLGAHIYAQSSTTDVLCAAYSFGKEIKVWRPEDPLPTEIFTHVVTGGPIRAYNAQFERLIWREVLGPRYGWPVPRLEQYYCVMARAYAMALPGSLEKVAEAMLLTQQKDMVGYRTMLQMSKPRKPRKGEDPNGIYWWDSPEKLEILMEYCKQDVAVEMAIDKLIPVLSDTEQRLYWLDQKINDQGVYIDRSLCEKALKVVDQAKERLDKEMRELTGDYVESCSAVSQLTDWLNANGASTETVAKAALEELLASDVPPHCRRALELRKEAAKSSTAKIPVLLARSEIDGFMRGNLQYHGAGTGRWAARGAQLQNLPRPSVKSHEVEKIIKTVMDHENDIAVELMHGPALPAMSDCIRGMIVAPPGYDLYAADFSAIEARVVAWLAGQNDILDVFRTGEDIYCYAASSIYNRSIRLLDKNDPPKERQVGKVAILALGYQGGVGAFATMAKGYNLDLNPAYESVVASASEEDIEKAEKAYKERGHLSGRDLTKEAWLTAELIKLAWRRANDKIVAFWKELNNAAKEAILNPGRKTFAGKYIKFLKSGSFLLCQLPSGRCLSYPYAKIVEKEMPWEDEDGKPVVGEVIQYMGVDSRTRKWGPQYAYGGLFCENVTQAVARDLMAEAMMRLDLIGYQVCITIHDEIVAYAPEGFGSEKDFSSIMETVPAWAGNCPVKAESWKGKRYKK